MGGEDTSSSTPHRRRSGSHEIDSPEALPKLDIVALSINYALHFTSFQEASEHLEVLEETRRKIQTTLLDAASDYLSHHHPQHSSSDSAKRFCLTYSLSRVITLASQRDFDKGLAETIEAYLSWKASLEQVLRAQYTLSGQSLLLRIRYFNALFSICSCRETRESSTDRFQNEFNEVLDDVEAFLEHWSSRAPHLERTSPDLSSQQALRGTGIFEWGPLAALATVAVKCRDSRTRRRAVDMLFTARRREGNHSSLTLAVWTDTIADLEEKRAKAISESDSATGVAEDARFADIAVCAAEHDESVFHLYTARFEHEKQGDVELMKYTRTVNGAFGAAFQTIRTPCEPRSVKDLGGEVVIVSQERFCYQHRSRYGL